MAERKGFGTPRWQDLSPEYWRNKDHVARQAQMDSMDELDLITEYIAEQPEMAGLLDERPSPLIRRPHDSYIELEPWSPLGLTESELVILEDAAWATMACENDGEYRKGKLFYCTKCDEKIRGFDEFARHRATHFTRESSVEASTSGLNNHQIGGGDDPYKIEATGFRTFASSAATETTYKVKFADAWQGSRLSDLHSQLHGLFEELLSRARNGINGNDLLRVVLRHDTLNNAIVVPLQPADELSVDQILEKVENVLQSEENLSLDQSFEVMVGAIHFPSGGARQRITKLHGPDNSIHKKRSMVEIVNTDDLCMSRAIGVGLAHHCLVPEHIWNTTKAQYEHLTVPQILLETRQISNYGYKNIKTKSRADQKSLALLICRKAGVPTDRPGNLNDLTTFEQALQVRIAVVAASLGNKFLRVPSNDDDDWPIIYLYLIDHNQLSHFHLISSISGFFSAAYFCDRCFKQYNNNYEHQCESTCLTCKSQRCPETDQPMSCRVCHMMCRSKKCFERHLEKKPKKNAQNDDIMVSECDEFWRCVTCKKVINRRKRPVEFHKCGEWKCKNCRAWIVGTHQCYLFPEEPKQPLKKMIFFDFETTQDTIVECTEGYEPRNCFEIQCKNCLKCKRCSKSWCGQPQHVPNFVVAQSVCETCKDEELTPESTCDRCGGRCPSCDSLNSKTKTFVQPPCPETCGFREVIFQGMDTLDNFGAWLFSAQHKDATVLAHNMKAFDGVFLLQYMIDQSMRPSQVIYSGSKLMYLTIKNGLNIRIIDSLNFLPMKLAALPKAFGLTEICKGYFPHFFNTSENQTYVGPYPETHDYGADYMSTHERTAFLKWHDDKRKSEAVFDFRKEIKDYCRSDVDILRRACMHFKQLMLDVTRVDCFQNITIASTCMAIYKTRFLEAEYDALITPKGDIQQKAVIKKTCNGWLKYQNDDWRPLPSTTEIDDKKVVSSSIAQVPSAGYTQRDNFSKGSIQWLEYQMELARRSGETLYITHGLNSSEERIVGTQYRVDGRSGNTVYEYHGCLWHGCTRCYPDRSAKHPVTGQNMDQLYAMTQIKRKVLTEDFRFEYKCIWEHEWLEKVSNDPDVQEFVESFEIQDRLDPRNSFFGGRTNAVKLHYSTKSEEMIKYVDFTSLYPYVNKYCRYPVGHPEIITSDFEDMDNYFGIAKVKILAPRGLYHPVLPYRCNGKLKFPLCRSCADAENTKTCRHNDEQRSFLGTWCTPEIQKAVEKGYKILKMYEIYHWAETIQYDSKAKEGGLFTSYVNTFLKIKQEASGWPEWCKTTEDKDQYVRDYFEKEGIRLNPELIQKNPGLRSLAKLCLNSFWGKFGQRLNLGISKFIHASELDTFYSILTDKTKKVNDFHIINEDHLHLQYEHQTGFVPEDMKTNIFIATFTTCWARLKLYELLNQLGERVLYYDTDSVIYVSIPGYSDPPLGDYLGDLTDELNSGDHIVEFVSGGPKNYAYSTAKGGKTCKIRGFSLNHTNSILLNFNSVKNMVTESNQAKKQQSLKRRSVCDAPETSKKQKLNPPDTISTVNPSKILRDKYQNIVYNKEEIKKYKVVYDKRIIQTNLDTLPYGF